MQIVGTLLVFGAMVTYACAQANPALKEVFHWKQVDYQFPDEATKKAAIASNEFVVENNLPLGVEVWKDKLFVTTPRWKSGIPSSLNYISIADAAKNPSPPLKPYPDWATNNIYAKNDNNATKIVSTFRVRADECDRLWVMDTGLADILGKPDQITPPKILIYDLKTDKLLHQYLFDKAHIAPDSFFPNIVVDTAADKCSDAYAYIPDLGSYHLIVYNLKTDKAFRVKHHFFYMDPLQGNYNVGGVNFQWTDGIFSLALAPINKDDGYRNVYFHALSSLNEFSVSSKILQNETAANNEYAAYKLLGNRGENTQATASFLDPKTGVLLYTQINKNGVGCWNSYTNANAFTPQTNQLVASDNETMIFPNDLKVDRESNLWLLTDRLPTYLYRKLDLNQVNYRIFSGPVKDIVKGTVCDTNPPPVKAGTPTTPAVETSSSSTTTTIIVNV